MDADESDIFVHCDDIQKAGIDKDKIRTYKQSEGSIRFSFKVMSYFGKYRESRKAVDLTILDDGLGMSSLYTWFTLFTQDYPIINVIPSILNSTLYSIMWLILSMNHFSLSLLEILYFIVKKVSKTVKKRTNLLKLNLKP